MMVFPYSRCSANVDFFRRDDLDLRRRGEALHRDAAEGLHVRGATVRYQRLGVFPLLDEHHLGRIGDALMQVISNVARLLAGFLDAGGGGISKKSMIHN